jgi:hypothetical protein
VVLSIGFFDFFKNFWYNKREPKGSLLASVPLTACLAFNATANLGLEFQSLSLGLEIGGEVLGVDYSVSHNFISFVLGVFIIS